MHRALAYCVPLFDPFKSLTPLSLTLSSHAALRPVLYLMCRYKESHRYLSSLYSRTIISASSFRVYSCASPSTTSPVCATAHRPIDVLFSRWPHGPHHIAELSHFRLTHFTTSFTFLFGLLQDLLTQFREMKPVCEREGTHLSIGQRGGTKPAELWLSLGVSFPEITGARIWLVMVELCYCSLVEYLLLNDHLARRQAGDRLPTDDCGVH